MIDDNEREAKAIADECAERLETDLVAPPGEAMDSDLSSLTWQLERLARIVARIAAGSS